MSLDLLVLQGTGACNLNCRYCYLPELSRRDYGTMSFEILRKAVRLILRCPLLGPQPTFLWHAGEPLLAGIDWMSRALKIIEEENVHGRPLRHSIQTNATLIDQRWIELFRRHKFDIGVSADGPAFLHDLNRRNWGGRGSHSKMLKGIEMLRSAGINYTGICVLTKDSLAWPDEIFDFFLDSGFSSVGFNVEEIEGVNSKSSLSSDVRTDFDSFLRQLCLRWIENEHKFSVREFELVSSKMVTASTIQGFVPVQDVAKGLKILTVRMDGSLITFSPELASGSSEGADAFVVGHIDDLEYLEDIISHPRFREIRKEIELGINLCKDQCRYFSQCGGGWPSNKYFEHGTFNSAETTACIFSVQSTVDTLEEVLFHRPEFRSSLNEYIQARSESN